MDFQEDIEVIDRMITAGEAQYNKWRHPDPYIGKCSEVMINIHLREQELWTEDENKSYCGLLE